MSKCACREKYADAIPEGSKTVCYTKACARWRSVNEKNTKEVTKMVENETSARGLVGVGR